MVTHLSIWELELSDYFVIVHLYGPDYTSRCRVKTNLWPDHPLLVCPMWTRCLASASCGEDALAKVRTIVHSSGTFAGDTVAEGTTKGTSK